MLPSDLTGWIFGLYAGSDLVISQRNVRSLLPTHYDTLGVRPSAKHDDIRRAYLDAARAYHPDKFVNEPADKSSDAENAMRKVNEAWRVLGDESRRASYDESLRPGSEHRTASRGYPDSIRTEDGITRIDPRLLDPTFLTNRRTTQVEELDKQHSSILRVIPVLAFFGLLIGIFVFTAYANGSSSTAPAETTVPGPSIGVDAGVCVRIQEGPSLIEVPCTGVIDGRVLGAYEPGGRCPPLTIREVTLANEITACLGE